MTRARRRFRAFPLAAALLASAVPTSVSPLAAAPRPPADMPQGVRVIQLREMSAEEAMKLLRVEIGIGAIATLPAAAVVVIRDLPDQLDRSEALLRERDAVASTGEPHGLILLQRPPDAVPVERFLALPPPTAKRAVTLLRALYGVREIELVDEPPGLRLRDIEPILDAVEALFAELGWLDGIAEPTPTH